MKNSVRMAVSNTTEYLVEVGLEKEQNSHISKPQAADSFLVTRHNGNKEREINKY